MKLFKTLISVIVWAVIIFVVTFEVGNIPYGLFCDEAQIAIIAHSILTGEFSQYFIAPFFYHHFEYQLGVLPVVSTVPFLLFGVSEMTVRLASVTYALLGLWLIYLTLKQLKAPALIPILMLAFSPLFFHIARINFGHAPSFMFMALGIFLYFKWRAVQQLRYVLLSGLAFAISAYGYAGYMLGAPLMVGCLVVGEICLQRFSLKKYLGIIKLVAVFSIIFSIIIWQVMFSPLFSHRLKDKSQNLPTDPQANIVRMVNNYPKYFSLDYLFLKGEIELPGSFVNRHSIRGNGIYLGVFLPILLIGWFGMVFFSDKQKTDYLPFFLLFLLAPLPDLFTTNDTIPPYSFGMFFGLIAVPFVTAYALRCIALLPEQLLSNLSRRILHFIFLIVLFIEIGGFMKNYLAYPSYSSDYWGWQSGPQEIMAYFGTQKENYDELFMTGYFNQPGALLEFYNLTVQCENCLIGGPEGSLNLEKKQLFALRPEELKDLQLEYKVKQTLFYPNGETSYLIIEPTSIATTFE